MARTYVTNISIKSYNLKDTYTCRSATQNAHDELYYNNGRGVVFYVDLTKCVY